MILPPAFKLWISKLAWNTDPADHTALPDSGEVELGFIEDEICFLEVELDWIDVELGFRKVELGCLHDSWNVSDRNDTDK